MSTSLSGHNASEISTDPDIKAVVDAGAINEIKPQVVSDESVGTATSQNTVGVIHTNDGESVPQSKATHLTTKERMNLMPSEDLDAKIAERKLKKQSSGSGLNGRRTSRNKKGRKKTASSMVISKTNEDVTAFTRTKSSSVVLSTGTGESYSFGSNLMDSVSTSSSRHNKLEEAVVDAGAIDEIKPSVVSGQPIESDSSHNSNIVGASDTNEEDSVLQLTERNENLTKKGNEKSAFLHEPIYAEDDKKTGSGQPLHMMESLTTAKRSKKNKKKDNQGDSKTSKDKSEKKKLKLIRDSRGTDSSDEKLNSNILTERRMSLDDKIITKMASIKNLDISDPFESKLTIEQKIARKQSVKNLEAVDLSESNIDDKIAKKTKGEEKKRSRRARSKSRIFNSLVMSLSSTDTEVTDNQSRKKGENFRSKSVTKTHDRDPKKKEKKRSASALPTRRKERNPSYDEIEHTRQDNNDNVKMPHISMLQDDPIMMVDNMMDNLKEKNRKRTSMFKR